MTLEEYLDIRDAVHAAGFTHEIDWSEGIKPPKNAKAIATELIFVICNSGMKAQVARGIFTRVMRMLRRGRSSRAAFKHVGKCSAIDLVWRERQRIFAEFSGSADKLAYLVSVPWIGEITKWHAAKNLGLDVAKPDRHLVRIAARFNTTPEALCDGLSKLTGDRVATVDVVLWRAANLGIIKTRT